MKLVVGLGNPKEKYSKNRHNVGAIAVDAIAQSKGLTWENSGKTESQVAVSSDYIYAKPQTFMNSSGTAVSKLLSFYKINLDDLVVIHDDVDLPFGEIRKQYGVGAAGHHGVESIIVNVGSQEFTRVRFGVGKPTDGSKVEDWVLKDMSDNHIDWIKKKALELSI